MRVLVLCNIMIVLLTACSSTKTSCNKEVIIGQQYFLTESEQENLTMKARDGSAIAAYRLGEYEEFCGDLYRAVFWYELSANLGYRQASETLMSLENAMEPAQWKKIMRNVKEGKAKEEEEGSARTL